MPPILSRAYCPEYKFSNYRMLHTVQRAYCPTVLDSMQHIEIIERRILSILAIRKVNLSPLSGAVPLYRFLR